MALTSTRLTADEYVAFPPSEQHTQLINGEIVVTEAALRHQRIAGETYAESLTTPLLPGFSLDPAALFDR